MHFINFPLNGCCDVFGFTRLEQFELLLEPDLYRVSYQHVAHVCSGHRKEALEWAPSFRNSSLVLAHSSWKYLPHEDDAHFLVGMLASAGFLHTKQECKPLLHSSHLKPPSGSIWRPTQPK